MRARDVWCDTDVMWTICDGIDQRAVHVSVCTRVPLCTQVYVYNFRGHRRPSLGK